MKKVTFKVLGEPKGKARPRVCRGHAYTPKKTVQYEREIIAAYRQQCKKALIFEKCEPVSVAISAFYQIPKSAPKYKKSKMASGEIYPLKKPDADNVIKVVLDALNGVAYADDSQVVCVGFIKRYAVIPRIEVALEGG